MEYKIIDLVFPILVHFLALQLTGILGIGDAAFQTMLAAVITIPLFFWLFLCFKDSAPGGREESPPRSSPQRVSGARQQIINLRQLAVDSKSASTCKVALCAPQSPFQVSD